MALQFLAKLGKLIGVEKSYTFTFKNGIWRAWMAEN